MRFIEVKELPYQEWRNRPRRDMKSILDEFMSMNIKIVRVEFEKGEYASGSTAHTCFKDSVRRYALPILVSYIQDNVYLVRTDI